MRSTTALLAACVATALALAACGGGGGTDVGNFPPSELGTLRIHVTDAPFPYDFVESATIVIEEIRVRDAGEPDEDAGWVTVFTGPQSVDLVPLTGGVSLPLVEADLPVGTYDQVRVIVDAGEVTLKPEAFVQGGDPVFNTDKDTLKFPSAGQSGLKVHIENGIEVVTQLSADLTLDFDLSKNFVFNGPVSHPPGVKSVLFTPVVRATNDSTTGSLQVTVFTDNLTPGDAGDDAPLPTASIAVFPDGTVGAPPEGFPIEAPATEAGVAVVQGLAPGTYDVVVQARSHAETILEDQVVVVANLTSSEITLAGSGEIAGTVMSDAGTPANDADDFPVGGVAIDAQPAGGGDSVGTDTSNDSGGWAVTGLGAGTFDVVLTKAGFADFTLPGVVSEGLSPGYLVILSSHVRTLSGSVVEGVAGSDGATVSLEAGGTVFATATADAAGAWSLPAVPTRTWTLVITSADGTRSQTVEVEVVGDAGGTTQTVPTVDLDAAT